MTLMFRLSLPLVGLVALLLVAPALAASPQTTSDPFRAIALQRPKQPEPPICCLRPLPAAEPEQNDDLLLSFEDWKVKRLQAPDSTNSATPRKAGQPHPAAGQPHGEPGTERASDLAAGDSPTPNGGAAGDDGAYPPPAEPGARYLPAHFRVPLTDRFNFAAVDCSARVHAAHREAKSAGAMLSAKKDRYMLAPCSARGTHVVVELCDDIRIDTVQLANFEFFSGVFRDLRVSVAKTYTTDPRGWTDAGTYRAKNVRGVQSFHPPTSLRDFYRYIRIDFLSHYGSEYYCPVSLLRVYGLTHLEEWKWEVWEAESREKIAAAEEAAVVVVAPPAIVAPSADEQAASASGEPSNGDGIEVTSAPLPTATTSIAEGTQAVTASIVSSARVGSTVAPSDTSSSPGAEASATSDAVAQSTPSTYLETVTALTTTAYISSPTVAKPPAASSSSGDLPGKANDSSASHTGQTSQSAPSSSSSFPTFVPTVTTLIVSSPHAAASHFPPAGAPASGGGGGESIYRTIMNRLTAAERNATLYARYVEEHTAAVREALRRLGEDVGRLEGITRAQAQTFQRSLGEMERQRRRVEAEHGELLRRVAYLSDEVMLEKRLGIAQLCLMLAVLMFIALTRGSRGDAPVPRRTAASAVRAWGRRNLSLSGDWVNRLRTRSLTSPQDDPDARRAAVAFDTAPFPSRRAPPTRTSSAESSVVRSPTLHTPRVPAPRPRTPLHRAAAARGTPTGARRPPPLQRTNSHGANSGLGSGSTLAFAGLGPVPRSARRWARSAHLHEVRSRSRERRPGFNGGAGSENGAPAGDGWLTAPARDDGGGGGEWKAVVRGRGMRRPLAPLKLHVGPPATAPALGGFGGGIGGRDEDDVHAWVDTDGGASDPAGASDGDDVFR